MTIACCLDYGVFLCCFNQASSHATGEVWSKTTQVDPFRCLFSAFSHSYKVSVLTKITHPAFSFWLRIKPDGMMYRCVFVWGMVAYECAAKLAEAGHLFNLAK
ncbi:hypothetical protein CEXT_269701, partial [Caerostris extrusa]